MTGARRVSELAPLTGRLLTSATMAAANAASTHPRPINLAIGEPCELPPRAATEAAIRAIRDGAVRYGPAAGLPELREACASDSSDRTGLEFQANEVLMTAGGKQGLHDALRCLVGAGDEVLVPAPYWPSFLQQVASAGAESVVVPPNEDLLPDPAALEAAAGERTKVLILNDPGNPTSRAIGRERLESIAELVQRRNLWVVLDEVYADLVLDGPHVGLLQVAPELRERVVLVQSFSKRFAMTGYRLGTVTAPRPIIEAMTNLMSASLTCANLVAQRAGLAALRDGRVWLDEQRERYRSRRDAVLPAVRAIPSLECARPDAAFYLFPRLEDGVDDVAWAARLREDCGVLLTPGSAFGAPGHARLSCAGRLEDLLEGVRRVQDAVQRWQREET